MGFPDDLRFHQRQCFSSALKLIILLTLISSRLQLLAARYVFLKEDSDFTEIQNDLSDIQRLLNYDRTARQPQLTLCSLQPLLNELYTSFLPVLHAQHIALYLHIASNLPAIRADLSLIRQALINLLKNAAEASPDGGRNYLICCSDDCNHLVLSVSDTGNGMTPEQLARILSLLCPIRQAAPGLDLQSFKSIVSAHHGHLSVKSVPGSGSSFCILLPIPLSPVEKSAQ